MVFERSILSAIGSFVLPQCPLSVLPSLCPVLLDLLDHGFQVMASRKLEHRIDGFDQHGCQCLLVLRHPAFVAVL